MDDRVDKNSTYFVKSEKDWTGQSFTAWQARKRVHFVGEVEEEGAKDLIPARSYNEWQREVVEDRLSDKVMCAKDLGGAGQSAGGAAEHVAVADMSGVLEKEKWFIK